VNEQAELPELPKVSQVLLSTVISLVNLAGIRLTEEGHKDVAEAMEAIDAARALLPLCPQEEIAPIRDAISQLQMVYVKEAGAHAAEPAAQAPDERAQARSKIWTPPGV
jgi:hypothetical protein